MRAEQAFAHHDLAPERLDELVLRRQVLGVGREILQDRERLAPKPLLGTVSPQSLVRDIESKRRERQHETWHWTGKSSRSSRVPRAGPPPPNPTPRGAWA